MSRLRKLTHMCSRTISGTAYRFRHGSTLCSPTVEKILCRSLFSKRSHIGNLRQIRKQGKGRSSKRKENRRLSFLFAPAAGAANPRAPQSATPPLGFSEQPPPVRGEHAYAVRTPRWVGAAKKGCRPERRSTNVPRVPQIVSAGKIKGRTMKVRPFPYSASCR